LFLKDKFNTFITPDLTKPPPSLLNQLPKITNQQAEMFSNILQKSATSNNNNIISSKNKRDGDDDDDDELYQNKRIKKSPKYEEKSEDKILREKSSLPPIKEKHLSSSFYTLII
jgi:hypothetical protein